MFVDPIARHSNFFDYSKQHVVVNTRECTCEVVVLLQPRLQGAFPKAKEKRPGEEVGFQYHTNYFIFDVLFAVASWNV